MAERECAEHMRFTCTSCGKVHEGLADLAFSAPYYYYTVPEAERGKRCILTSDLCSIDDSDFFIRGCLQIPIINKSQTFTWGARCSVRRANFDLYLKVLNEPHQSHAGPFFGWFSSCLRGYPETLSLKVMAHLRDHKTRLWFELEESGHLLSSDYRHGISTERLQQIYEANLRP